MSYNFFAYLSRMRYISRWSLMRNAIDENIQEHSHQVAVLAHALGVIRRDVFGVDCDPEEYAAVALYHDSSEIREAYRQVEELACEKLLATLPEPLRASFGEMMTGQTAERCRDLVKAADKLSAYIKCIEERKTGNDEFLSAEKQTRAILEESALPEVRYFLDNFIPAFELTLDELGTIG